jgi:DNA repair protein RadC
VYASELTVRYRLRRVPGAAIRDVPVTTPLAAASILTPLLRDEAVEVAVVLCLTSKLELLAFHTLSRGTLDHAFVTPRDVFRTALLANAGAVILGHNHPSGCPEPSAVDLELTRRLVAASAVMGIDVHDHIIMAADGRWFSFKQGGYL